jgi:alpha-tubulin suppressor-like RCC1 family protein
VTGAVPTAGVLWAWGWNESGQVGMASSTDVTTPVPVSGMTNTIAAAGGALHSLAVRSDGTAWAWGWNAYGMLGNGTTTDTSVPTQVLGLTGVVAVAGGYWHSLALLSNGTVWAWGSNEAGQLGDPAIATCTNQANGESNSPAQVGGLTGVVAIAAGDEHSLALKSDGTVWAWGDNSYGELGAYSTSSCGSHSFSTTPVQVSNLTNVVAIAAGNAHSLAIRADGTVWAWGDNRDGQLGNTTTQTCYGPLTDPCSTTPVQVTGLAGATSIAGGYYFSLAVRSDGTAWAWGFNGYGQLGDGTTTDSTNPVQVSGLTDLATVAVADDGITGWARRSDGTVWAWGNNLYGQLGNGTTTSTTTPVQVSGLTGVTALAAGAWHALAIVASLPAPTATTPAPPTATATSSATATATQTPTPSSTATATATPAPRLLLNPRSVQAGRTVHALGGWFEASETVLLKWNSATGVSLKSAVTTAQGVFGTTITIPSRASPGQHLIFAVGQTSHATASAVIMVQVLKPELLARFREGRSGTQ